MKALAKRGTENRKHKHPNRATKSGCEFNGGVVVVPRGSKKCPSCHGALMSMGGGAHIAGKTERQMRDQERIARL